MCRTLTGVYAAGSAGTLACLDPDTGAVYWTFDVGKQAQAEAQLFSSPTVTVTRDGDGERRRIYFGAGLNNYVSIAAAVYCFEDRAEEPTGP
jgi:outer membrane protein assembly factor BamB